MELVNDHVHLRWSPQRLLAVAPAQEIQRGVVRDPEQPAFGMADIAGISLRLHRLDQRILQHIFAVDDRADHARAVAMQFWPHRNQQPLDVEGGGRLGHPCHSASGKRVQFSPSMR
jgi:hypothetical protein